MAFWDPEIDLELDEGEKVLVQCRHHWSMLVRNTIIPLTVALLFGLLAFYRAIGGGLFKQTDAVRELDWITIVILAVMAILLFLWARGIDMNAKRNPKSKLPINLSWIINLGIVLLALLAFYRYNGGRVIDIDPSRTGRFDALVIVFAVITVVALIYAFYQVIDWLNDGLILTNNRIVLQKDDFLIRRIQEQILLVDVQQVFLRQNTYPQVILKYGSLTVQAFSLKKINFDYATRPDEMERQIKEQLTKTRRQLEPNLVRRMIQDRVFEERKPQETTQHFYVRTRGANRTGLIAWLFPANPQIDEKSGSITWRPSSVYVGLLLLRPFGLWLLGSIALFLATPWYAEFLWAGIVAWAILTVVCTIWIFWLREEYVNDVYILTKREIIDVDKKPLGPQTRRSAPIDRIQNIFFDVSFYEQILGYGTVKIQTGGSGDFSFNHVPDPRGVQAMLNDYLTDFKKGAEERNLQNSIDVFREYHALQRDRGELVDRPAIDQAIDEKSQAAVAAYANEVAPIQIALQVREAMRAQSRLERRARLRRLLRRNPNQG